MTMQLDSTERPGGMSLHWVRHVTRPGYRKYCPDDSWAPPINIYEYPDHYCVVVALPGVSVADGQIEVEVHQGRLTISGHRVAPLLPDCEDRPRVHLMEIDHGRFYRAIELPGDVDIDSAVARDANYGNGYLWIKLPKRQ